MKPQGKMTLEELEALAARTMAAARTLQEAVAMLGSRQELSTPIRRQVYVETQPGPVNLATPARLEYAAGNPPATEEDAVGLNPAAPSHLAEARQQRAAFLRQAKAQPQRAEALAQFKHDAPEEE